MRSVVVVLPASTCAMMPMLRMFSSMVVVLDLHTPLAAYRFDSPSRKRRAKQPLTVDALPPVMRGPGTPVYLVQDPRSVSGARWRVKNTGLVGDGSWLTQ